MLYRLAVSPGSRALIGLRPRSGRVVRPLLGFTRAQIREGAIAAGIPFADDPTNDSLAFARNRIRAEVEPVLSDIGPEFERNAAETHAELLEEAEFMRDAALRAIAASGSGAGAPLRHEELATMAPALRRTVLTILAERASGGRPVRISRSRTASIVRLCADPEGGVIELGRGLVAICEAGTVRFAPEGGEQPPEPVRLTIPGRARYGDWEITAPARRRRRRPGRARARHPRRGRARLRGRDPLLARRRPDQAARPRRHQDPAGPVHRQRRAALAAGAAARRRRRRADRVGGRSRRLGGVPARAARTLPQR